MRLRAAAAAVLVALAAAASAGAADRPVGDGAWSWFGDPRAVTHDGRTYVGWVDHEGDIKVSSYDHATGERVTALLQARLNQDDHANPSLHVRPDGRLVVFYSRHVGPSMHYRVSSQPEDVSSWGAPQTVPTNSPGIRGYTYPNPVRLEDEGATYLFWRGGNYNPTFSVQADGGSTWSPARTLITMPGERPYVKYDSSGGDTIHMAYTNAHPNEFASVNIYYARVRAGLVERVGGQPVGSLNDPISPAEGDLVYDATEPTWVHDVAADSAGRPVIVFASFPSASDHRYHYARWTGSAWDIHQITPAGGSFRGDGGSPYYSGGLTLDHEDPSRVYLARQYGSSWQVETWTTPDGGTTWTSESLTAGSLEKNVRPVSPRGMSPFGGELGVVWMRGPYQAYVDYGTAITATTAPAAANQPPVADAEPAVRSGRAPLEVRFDPAPSRDLDGSIASWEWDFGDGSGATGADQTHTYASGGRYFPTLTVTDDDGASSVFVDEIVVDLPAAPTVHSGGASGSTVHGAVSPENQATTWSVEYGPTIEYGAVTPAQPLPGDSALHQVSAQLPGLEPGRLYHYHLVADNASGSSSGEDRVFVAGSSPGSDAYRDDALATPGLTRYWRIGELSGGSSREETQGGAGPFEGRFVLGQVGVLGPLGNTAASFDGLSGGLAVPGPALAANATLEGWFRWRAGVGTLRDHTGSAGWLLAFNRDGSLAYRLGGQGFMTSLPIDAVRDGDWHHLAATKQGAAAALYIDGQVVHSSGAGAGSTPATSPWHIMRNGTNAAFSEGEADEVALYDRALTAAEIDRHHDLARAVAASPLPAEQDPPAAEPPLAGTGLGGGVLASGSPLGSQRAPTGVAFVRRGRLIVRGAPGVRNRLVARRRGRSWRVRDALARLRAGAGCRRLGPRSVSCRAARVTRIDLYGGAGNDRLTVVGRVKVVFHGGPGRDVTARRGSARRAVALLHPR